MIKFAGDVLADTDEMRVLAHAPATAPLGGSLRSPSASSLYYAFDFILHFHFLEITGHAIPGLQVADKNMQFNSSWTYPV